MINAEANQARRRILLVDDHPVVLIGMKDLINRAGDLVVSDAVTTASDAIARVRDDRPDLAIVDLSLKESDGIALIKEIKQITSDLPVLVMSMHDETLHAERVLRAGAQGYVMKDQPDEQVLVAIRTVLSKEVYLSPKMASTMLRRLVNGKPVPESGTSRLRALTDREMQIFMLLGQGLSPRDISARLSLSLKTVETHRDNIRTKLGLQSGLELLRFAIHYSMQ